MFAPDAANLVDYRANLDTALNHCSSHAQTDKYDVVDGQPVPQHYPGVTLLGCPFLGMGDKAGGWLAKVGRQLERHLPNFVSVCLEESHVTICDFEAGNAFTRHLGKNHTKLNAFLDELHNSLKAIPSSSEPIEFRLAGLGWFPKGPVVAFLDLADEASYDRVVEIRKAVGVIALEHKIQPLPFGFLGHMTVGYPASPLPPELLSSVLAPYRSLAPSGLKCSVSQVGCFGFSDMAKFSPLGPTFSV